MVLHLWTLVVSGKKQQQHAKPQQNPETTVAAEGVAEEKVVATYAEAKV